MRSNNIGMCSDGNTKRYYKMIAVVVANINTTKFIFPQDDTLKGSRILAVESYSLSDFTKGPGGIVPVNATVFPNAFLTLKSVENNEEVITSLNLERIRSKNNSGESFPVCTGRISPSDCFVEVGATTGLVANEVFFIGVHFERNN